jgi:hypothetical protein
MIWITIANRYDHLTQKAKLSIISVLLVLMGTGDLLDRSVRENWKNEECKRFRHQSQNLEGLESLSGHSVAPIATW